MNSQDLDNIYHTLQTAWTGLEVKKKPSLIYHKTKFMNGLRIC